MAVTARNLIKNAYRKSGIVALGATLNSLQTATGLELLQQVYSDLVTKGTLGKFKDVYTTTNCEAAEQERVMASVNTLTISRPTTVSDPYVTGGIRAPKDGALIAVVGPGRTATHYVYSAHKGDWEALEGFALTDPAPMSDGYKSDLEALLAGLLADERGIPVGPLLAAEIRTARYHFASRANTASDTAEGTYM